MKLLCPRNWEQRELIVLASAAEDCGGRMGHKGHMAFAEEADMDLTLSQRLDHKSIASSVPS
jgi:hypothetical protein